MKAIDCTQAQELIKQGGYQLVDVREQDEFELCKIDGAILLPLSTFPDCLEAIKPNIPTIFYCHHGRRSANACVQADGKGFAETLNLTGGIDAWSLQIDNSVTRY